MSDIPPAPPTTQDILAVVNAATVDEQLRLITERPALLLTDTVDAVLQPLLEHYANDPHTTRILAQAQSLLRRCREVGLAVVRTEMTGPQQSNALAIPPQFRLLFEQAQAALQRYHDETHDLDALDAAMGAWDAILYNPTFAHAPGTFRLAVLHDVSITLNRRFSVRGNLNDLTWAIELLQAAVAATPIHALGARIAIHCQATMAMMALHGRCGAMAGNGGQCRALRSIRSVQSPPVNE